MANSAAGLQHGDEYVVLFKGGPYDGQTDRRISTDGSWDTELTMIASSEGMESMLSYKATAVRTNDGQLQVLYAWDKDDSEPLQDPEDRWNYDI